MKKTIVALAIAGLAASAGASAANIYNNNGSTVDLTGRVKSTFTNGYDQNESGASSNSQFDTSGRLGFDLTQKLNDQWSALASAQWDVVGQRADNGKGFESRNIYAGFDGQQYGKVTVGQNDGAYYTGVVATTDIFNEFGDAANAVGERQQGIMNYDNSFNGLGIHLSAGASAKDATADANTWVRYGVGNGTAVTTDQDRHNTFGGALDYTFDMKDAGALGLAAGYQSKTFNVGSTNPHQQDWAMGVNYTWNGLYAAAMFNKSKFSYDGANPDKEASGYELALSYTIEQWKLLTGYNKLRADTGTVTGTGERDFVNHAIMEVQYNFTSNILAYTSYKIAGKVNAGTESSTVDQDNQWITGLVYNF
ncbi:porin [Dongshaea marina]|uniref:porin n=1 Tax=Dongshaea marina TaxID=2047966 RepID=UPI000D3E16EC|nr:porin [Dongshaea marina]